MQITTKHIDKRLEKLQAELLQARANMNAIEGAIQDLLYWKEVMASDMTEDDLFEAIQRGAEQDNEQRNEDSEST